MDGIAQVRTPSRPIPQRAGASVTAAARPVNIGGLCAQSWSIVRRGSRRPPPFYRRPLRLLGGRKLKNRVGRFSFCGRAVWWIHRRQLKSVAVLSRISGWWGGADQRVMGVNACTCGAKEPLGGEWVRLWYSKERSKPEHIALGKRNNPSPERHDHREHDDCCDPGEAGI